MPILFDDIFTDDFEDGAALSTKYTTDGFGTPTNVNGSGNGGGWGVDCTGISAQGGRITNTTPFAPDGATGCAQWDLFLSDDGLTAVGDPHWLRVRPATGAEKIIAIGFSGSAGPYDLELINQLGTFATVSGVVPGGEWFTIRVAWKKSSTALATDGQLFVWIGPDEDNLESVYGNSALDNAYSADDWAKIDWTIDFEGFLDNIKVGNGGEDTPEPITGSLVAGVDTTVKATRAIAFGLDGETNVHDEAGKFKVFGKADFTDVVGTFRGLGLLTEDPASPEDGTYWLLLSSSPEEVVVRARIAGVTSTVISDDGGGSGNSTETTAFGSDTLTTAGDLNFYTNSYYVSRHTGSVPAPWGPIFKFTAPVSGSFAWVNQGTSTIDTTNGGITLVPQSVGASNSVRLRVKSAPSTPYTITAAFLALALNDGANATSWGLAWRESGTGELITVGIQFTSTGASNIAGFDWASPTDAAPTANFAHLTSTQMPVAWLRITDNGTNRITSISPDGQHWMQLQSEGRTTFLTADQVGFFAYQSTGSPDPVITLLSWQES